MFKLNRNFKTKLVIFVRRNAKKGHIFLQSLRKHLKNRKRFIFVLLLILSFSIITLSAIVPSNHIFEGNLIVEEMSFTFNGNESKELMEEIRSINQLEVEGIQTLTFSGKFQSESFPQLNQLNNLKVEMIDRKSKYIITPANSKDKSEISLSKLKLQPNTKVDRLNYDWYRQQLALSIKKLEPDNKPNFLNIYFGEHPIKISLENYKLPDLNLPNIPNEQPQLEFIYSPDNKASNLKLLDNSLYITLQKPPKLEGRIQAKNLRFERFEKNPDSGEILDISTIVEGKIRLAEQEREIKANQFLMGESLNVPLNIQLIRNIEIIPKKGLEVRFSGRDKQITIGLDKNFPVTRIQGSWLDGILPRDAIIALFSFGAAMVANLFSWLLSNSSKPENSP